MVTSRNLDEVVRLLRRTVRQWDVPAVTHYQQDPFKTLISCLLSLRTRDAVTLQASKQLFRLARTPRAMAALPVGVIERAIYPVSFYRNKAGTLREVCRTLLSRYGGCVPDELEELLTIRGVGRKTANLVMTLAFSKPGICVDTHVHRISNRWGYVKTRTPEQTEMALRQRLPARYWRTYNDLLVSFGQHLCHPTSPWCSRCPLSAWCPRRGVQRTR